MNQTSSASFEQYAGANALHLDDYVGAETQPSEFVRRLLRLGTEDEILMAGNLCELMGNIERMQAKAKARKGWVMDTYLLRKHDA
jgi:precorrin-2 methylase